MTLRSRPATRRSDRSREKSRRTFFTNLAFGVVVVVAVLILVGAAGLSYYNDHFAGVASVNGQSISKDDLTNRYAVDIWRLNKFKSRIRDEIQAGRITKDQGDQQISAIDQELQSGTQLISQTVQQLEDTRLQSQLASQMGISVTDQQVDDRLAQEATTTEQRHVWMIEISPEAPSSSASPSATPTTAQREAAKAAADVALTRLKSDQKWEVVAKVATAPGSDDQGYVAKDTSNLDPAFLNAVFALNVGEYTPVVEGADGAYRIGRVTDINPQVVDPGYQDSIVNAGVSLSVYKQAVRADLVREALQKRIVDDSTTKPSENREVSEIVLNVEMQTDPSTGQSSGVPITVDQVKVRHILYTPEAAGPSPSPGTSASPSPSASDSASASPSAAPTPIPSTDPRWAAAKAKAEATYQILKKDPSKFAEIAKRDSADTGSAANGGDLPYYPQDQLDPAFGAAVFKAGLVKDQLLEPVASSFGWHVIQFIDRKVPATTRATGITLELAKPGADFAAIATKESEGDDAAKGGAMGWIAHYQLDKTQEDAIFKLAAGSVSAQVVDGNKIYIFKVTKIETRPPDATQVDALKASGFDNWYAAQKAKATIKTDPAYSSTGTN